MKKEQKNKTVGVVLLSLIFITFVVSLLIWKEQSRLTEIYTYKNELDYLNAATQRLYALIESESVLAKEVIYISDINYSILTFKEEIPFFINNEALTYTKELLEYDEKLCQLTLFNDDQTVTVTNKIDLPLIRDGYFRACVGLSAILTEEALLIQDKINQYQAIILTLLVSMVVTMLNFPFKSVTKPNEDFIDEC